jgi:putative addiction module CopG family antidote
VQKLIVNLTPDLHDFVQTNVESGRYESAGELVHVALRTLLREKMRFEATSLANDIAKGDVFRRLWDGSIQSSMLRE